MPPDPNLLYKTDTVAWADEQVRLLRDRCWNELDLANLIEEIQDLGQRYRDALESHLTRLMMHRLKQRFQSEKSTRSWERTVHEASKQIRRLLRKHPSLRTHLLNCLDECYGDAREDAADQTGVPSETFPDRCPIDLRQEVQAL